MKNILIFILLGVFVSSCSQSKYASIDSQFTNSSDRTIQAKYNNKNCIEANKRKKELVKQIALSTQE